MNLDKQDASLARLVMRAEGVLRVILNVRLLPRLPLKMRDDKYVEFLACEKGTEWVKFLVKLGNRDAAEALYQAILEIVGQPESNHHEKVGKEKENVKVEKEKEKVEKERLVEPKGVTAADSTQHSPLKNDKKTDTPDQKKKSQTDIE